MPVVPPANPGDVQKDAVKRLDDVEVWANTGGKPFPGPGAKAMPIALLDPGGVAAGVWDVQAKTEDGRPLIATMPYGMGNITYHRLFPRRGPFQAVGQAMSGFSRRWSKICPSRAIRHDRDFGVLAAGENGVAGNDLISGIYNELENFDVNVVPFGYVALFIILYILVVGPLDYFVLKHVFHKLEWTWITFPAVVLAVSVAAYFTAYALKGNDLKINKIDIVDFDLRTELDGKQRTARAFVLWPNIFHDPEPAHPKLHRGRGAQSGLLGRQKLSKPLSADQVSWLGRPELEGFGAMGRSGSQGFFRRAYSYAEEAKGMRDVPIPVWTTKAFDASWEAALPKAALSGRPGLSHTRVQGKNFKLTGTIKNNLGRRPGRCLDLFRRSLLSDSGRSAVHRPTAAAGQDRLWKRKHQKDIAAWVDDASEDGCWRRERRIPARARAGTIPLRSFARPCSFGNMTQAPARNHNMRHLDFGWRFAERPGAGRNPAARGHSLCPRALSARPGRRHHRRGPVLCPPTFGWASLPDGRQDSPVLAGTLAQDTYIRVLLPVRPFPSNNQRRESCHDRNPRPDEDVRRPVRPQPPDAQAGEGRRLRLHRPQRRRQDHHHAHPGHAAQPDLGRGDACAATRSTTAPRTFAA